MSPPRATKSSARRNLAPIFTNMNALSQSTNGLYLAVEAVDVVDDFRPPIRASRLPARHVSVLIDQHKPIRPYVRLRRMRSAKYTRLLGAERNVEYTLLISGPRMSILDEAQATETVREIFTGMINTQWYTQLTITERISFQRRFHIIGPFLMVEFASKRDCQRAKGFANAHHLAFLKFHIYIREKRSVPPPNRPQINSTSDELGSLMEGLEVQENPGQAAPSLQPLFNSGLNGASASFSTLSAAFAQMQMPSKGIDYEMV